MSTRAIVSTRIIASNAWTKVIWRAWRSLTWREWRIALCYAAAMFVLVTPVNLIHGGGADGVSLATCAIDSLSYAVLLVACISVADEVARERAIRWRPYLVAAIVSAVLATTTDAAAVWLVGGDVYTEWKPAVAIPSTAAFYLQTGMIATFAYAQYRWSNAGAVALHAVQVERARIQREVVAVRLRAMQARVEPLFLFNALHSIEELCIDEPGRADSLLGALIDYLRAALPDLAAPLSRLGREVRLAQSYVAVATGLQQPLVLFEVTASAEAREAEIAPMVVPTLVASLVPLRLRSESAMTAIRLGARVEADRLHITVAADYRATPDDTVGNASRVHDLLREAYERDTRLVRRASGSTTIEFELELPH